MEKLKAAIRCGADAVYFGTGALSLRQGAENLSPEEIRMAMDFLHERGKRGYLALNIYARNDDLPEIRRLLHALRNGLPDAFLVSDPGILDILKEEIPEAEIHLSTQANLTNLAAARFWVRQGVRRLVLARELSLAEIRSLRDGLPEEIELEAFVHGAMCMAYSGRCLLSSFMTGRDANRGACAHPCRYRYALLEEKRPGEYFPIEEDSRGSYILHSRDLCMIRHLPDLIRAGVTSLKIEGRNKGVYYCASVVRAYRAALNAWENDPEGWAFQEDWQTELEKAGHRPFTTGFFYGPPGPAAQAPETSAEIRPYLFCGRVLAYDEEEGRALVEQRNKMVLGDTVELFGPSIRFRTQVIRALYDAETGAALTEAPHPRQRLWMPLDQPAAPGDLIRKRVTN